MKDLKFRTRFSRPKHPGLKCPDTPEDRRTKQEFREETDINSIMRKYERTGQLPDLILRDPRYGDFSDVPPFREAMDRVMFAQRQFMALPAKVRAEFDNDPAAFLEFASDPANVDELVDMGLLSRKAQEPLPEAPGTGSRGVPPGKEPKAPKSAPKKPDSGDDT